MLAGGLDLPPTESLHPGADPVAPPSEIENRKSKIVNPRRKAGRQNATGAAENVSEKYRKMMHPELVPESPAPKRGGRHTPEALQIIDAMRVIAEPFRAADLSRATGIEADFPNHICRALVRGWLVKHERGSYMRSKAFPASEAPAT